MGEAAPIILAEMKTWTSLGGGNSGIVGNAAHTYGFHVAADELPSSDYSRTRDHNGADGPYINWNYACAGDFDHKNDPVLRHMHADVLWRLMHGELPMICEFIGKPWADGPVYYWARWNGVDKIQKYTGQGHDHWSHISWFRSKVDEAANLWTAASTDPAPVPTPTPTPVHPVVKRGDSGDAVRHVQMFFRNNFPAYRNSVGFQRYQLIVVDGSYGYQTEAWVKEFQKRTNLPKDGVVGPATLTKMRSYGYKY
jgi:hypothetical protein